MKYLLLFFSFSLIFAEDAEDEIFDPQLKITNHTIELKSGPLSYTAVTGMCPIATDEEIEAELFFISYTKNTEENRPITFVFPGGPGGAGSAESILTFGPRRLLTADEGRTVHPPYKMIDNPQTLLEYTDLVFVDPASCGFSKVTEKGNPFYFFSVDGDIQSLGEFIRTYIDTANRWDSPIYLAGGSYGTLRCSGLGSNLLQYGISVKGLILDGCAFEFDTLIPQRDHPLPNCLILPTYAATAWYYGRLWPEKTLHEVVDYARRFVYDEYTPFILQPTRLSFAEKTVFEKRLAELTGLSLNTIKRFGCRIDETTFTTEFFGPERKILGRLDTRYSGDVTTIDPKEEFYDPSYLDSLGIGAGFNNYLQKELDTHFPLTKYIGFNPHVFFSWNFDTYDSIGNPRLLQRLRKILVMNPQMKIFVGAGYYDCRTPFAATEYCFEHLDLPDSYRKNLQFEYYEAGHGLFFDFASLSKMRDDLVKFYGKTQ